MSDQNNNQSGVKVLLAEDDKFLTQAYTHGLKRAGFTVAHAPDGEAALEKIRAERPDIVLLDLIMPVKNGFEVLEELQKDETLKTIPVIILSNLGQETDIRKGKEMGARDYLIKSNISMQEVIGKVKEALGLAP